MIEFTSLDQMLRDTEQSGLPLWENILLSDCARQNIPREESMARMTAMLEVMVQADESYRAGDRSASAQSAAYPPS